MSAYVDADSVDIVKDEEGALVYISFECPYCHYTDHKSFYVSDPEDVESDFETDQECTICGKNVTVGCTP